MSKRKFSNQRGPSPYHGAMQGVRAHLGLTQDDLALLLRASRTAVSMAECGERTLPWEQEKLVQDLFQAVKAAQPVPAGPLVLSTADRDGLDLRRQRLRLDHYPLAEKLAALQVRLAQARCWQRVLPQLRAAFPADDARAQQWLDLFERRAAGLLDIDAGAPALLQVRLAAIEFEMAEITRLLGDGEAVAAGK
jgi:DNA-binding XRE family transcriptional regulator